VAIGGHLEPPRVLGSGTLVMLTRHGIPLPRADVDFANDVALAYWNSRGKAELTGTPIG
jgi:hypothetical protein